MHLVKINLLLSAIILETFELLSSLHYKALFIQECSCPKYNQVDKSKTYNMLVSIWIRVAFYYFVFGVGRESKLKASFWLVFHGFH